MKNLSFISKVFYCHSIIYLFLYEKLLFAGKQSNLEKKEIRKLENIYFCFAEMNY